MNKLVDRFKGDAGHSNLIDSMLQQQIVSGNRQLAEELADLAELVEVAEGEAIISQGGDDDDLFLIVSGSFRIVVNGRNVASRGRGDHVGEMVLVEPSQRRSADVVAAETALVAKLTSANVSELASRYSDIYRVIARTLARRLLERNKLVGQHREKVRVFIISSAEALEVARTIQNALAHDGFVVRLWTNDVFKVASYSIESLETELDDSDFAVAIAHSDDTTLYRGQDWPTPRDNVVFELGMFMGRLGRTRAILMEPREDKVRLPSDLAGVTTIPYSYQAGKDAAAIMAPACNALRSHFNELGPFNG
ncbi:MAG TPA: TIR domain-containing protein [Pelagibacterium sp.]|uniref:TIR domain-containing protein n=1 Tax=Pelagibacterium sp. TaxID=1967288 RepID=UPI002C3DCA93|nr:TIR domain-containing protein [Pelagibacterium sp.]HWJ89279.1 TIR domain-containing protein [Pelagibacterium sp.]